VKVRVYVCPETNVWEFVTDFEKVTPQQLEQLKEIIKRIRLDERGKA